MNVEPGDRISEEFTKLIENDYYLVIHLYNDSRRFASACVLCNRGFANPRRGVYCSSVKRILEELDWDTIDDTCKKCILNALLETGNWEETTDPELTGPESVLGSVLCHIRKSIHVLERVLCAPNVKRAHNKI